MTARHEHEKRRLPRVQPYVVPCRLALPNGRLLAGYVTDLSPRGAQVACDGPPPAVGIVVRLEIRLRRGGAWPRLRAEVIWTKPPAKAAASPTCGVKFTHVGRSALALLEATLEEFRHRAAQLGKA